MILALRDHYADHLRPIADHLPEMPDTALVASFADIREAKSRGIDRIVLAQHGIGQSYGNANPHYPGGRGNDAVGLFLVPNGHAAARWRQAYPDARVEVVGSPRLDDLPRRASGPPTVAISFHWNAYHTPESRSAFDYYKPAIEELAGAVNLIGHAHPRRTDLARWYAKVGIEFVPSFGDVCRRADVYVADNTSTLFEFAATGRNVVVLNAPYYRRDVDFGLRFWDAANVGINVNRPDQLVGAVEWALAHDDTANRDAALEHVFAFRDGGAKRAADAILDWAA